MKKISLFLLFVFLVVAGNVWARQTVEIEDQAGRSLFWLDIADADEIYANGNYSKWTLDPNYIDAFKEGLNYWSSIIGERTVVAGSTISVGTFDMIENASASSPYFIDDTHVNVNVGTTVLTNATLFAPKSTSSYYQTPAHAVVNIGKFSNLSFDKMSILPESAGTHIAAVMTHEIGHAMGIASSAGENEFDEYLTLFDVFLYDSTGTRAGASKEIVLVPNSGNFDNDSSIFQVLEKGYVFFQGTQVLLVLRDGNAATDDNNDRAIIQIENNSNYVKGIPILGFEDGSPDFSHIELRNSMMSHQGYRNWTTFMEAELALLQDVGVTTIKREDFYGRSIYYNNEIVPVALSFTKDTSLAIGLHIYGTTNTVTMTGTVVLGGDGSAGIRVDGWDNTLTIDSNITVSGDNGTGLMVAYGKNHSITQNGKIEATGDDGIAVRFDFGNNILSNATEYRGSYIRTSYGRNDQLLNELQGPLVSSFNVIGSIEGSKAAIYISQNAFVKEINVMGVGGSGSAGATIIGDIISEWNPNSPLVQNSNRATLITTMTFGKDANGDFVGYSYEYAGNIISSKSIDLLIYGGTFEYSGEKMILSSFKVASDAEVTFIPVSLDVVEIDASQIVVDEDAKIFIDITGLSVPADTFLYNEGGFFSIVKFNSSNISFNGTNELIGDLKTDLPALSIGFYNYTSDAYQFSSQGLPVVKLANTNRTLNTNKTGFNHNVSAAPLLITLQNPAGNFIFKRTQKIWNKNISRLHGNAFNVEREYNKSSLWVRPMYNTAKGKSDLDYDITGTGIALGADHWFSDVVFGGIGGSIDMPKYKTDVSDIQTNLMRGFVYGGIFLAGDIGINVFAAMGQASYDQNRKSNNETYTASYTGTQMEGGIEIERVFYIGKQSQITPFASFGYINLDIENYDEKGGKSNLHYDLEPATTQQISLGLKYKYDISSQFSIGSQAFYKILSGDKQGKAQFSLVDDPYKFEKLPVTGQEADAGSIGFGLDFIYSVSQALNLNAGYILQTGSNQINHQIGMDLSVHF